MMHRKRFDVVALGEGMVEFNQTRPGEPQYLQGFGGDTSNAIIAAARAGARTAYLTRLGQDSFGQSLRDLWQREGVNTEGIEQDSAAPTGLYFVTHGEHGHEFSYRRAGSAASGMTPAWLAAAPADTILRSTGILHLSGISLAISASACATALQAMRQAAAAGALVSFDSNLRLKLWSLEQARPKLLQAIALCQLFLPSLEELQALCGEQEPERIVDWCHAQGAARVVLKLGEQGCIVSEGEMRTRIEGYRVPLRDATGAGDCFCGNLLARLAAGDRLLEAARYANAAAALAVQGFGAVAPLPRPDQVRALL